jgi:hypothetical protein
MKKISILFTAIFFFAVLSQAQVLVKWTFPTGNPSDSIADGGTSLNLDKVIHTEGGTSAIDYSKNGATTKSAQATGWENGSGSKCWVIKVNTQGYENIKLSSKMQSGGNNPGPKDYKGQYRLGEAGSWVDIPGAVVVVANDWSTGVLDSVLLPVACNDQAALYIRWIMTSNTNSTGGTVASNGINKVDDIYVSGQPVIPGVKNQRPTIGLKVSPNPSTGLLVVEASENIASLSVFNSGGKCVYKQSSLSSRKLSLNLDSIPSGTYFLKVKTTSGKEGSEKIVKM